MFTLLLGVVCGLFGIVFAFFLYRKYVAHQFLKSLSIPGPKPHWLFGNVLSLVEEGTRHLVIADWTKNHGKVFGYYEGPKPTIVISDVNLVQQVFVKQFPNFHGRKMFSFQPNPDTATTGVHMFFSRGSRWKRLRTIISPTFSANKLRAMTPLVDKCLTDFMDLIDKKAATNKEFNIFDCYRFLTLDTISECAFGIELNSAKTEGENNVVLDTISDLFKRSFNIPIYVKIAMFLPELVLPIKLLVKIFAQFMGSGYMSPTETLNKIMDEVIESRKNNPETRRPDLLQAMLELEDPNAGKNKRQSVL